MLFYATPQKEKSWFTPRVAAWETWEISVEVVVARTEREQVGAKKMVAGVLREKLIEICQRTGEEKVWIMIYNG